MKLFNNYTTTISKDVTIPLWKRILQNKLYRMALGFVGGGIAGFLYWYFIGCTGNSCPITSSPYQTTLIFGLLGGYLTNGK